MPKLDRSLPLVPPRDPGSASFNGLCVTIRSANRFRASYPLKLRYVPVLSLHCTALHCHFEPAAEMYPDEVGRTIHSEAHIQGQSAFASANINCAALCIFMAIEMSILKNAGTHGSQIPPMEMPARRLPRDASSAAEACTTAIY